MRRLLRDREQEMRFRHALVYLVGLPLFTLTATASVAQATPWVVIELTAAASCWNKKQPHAGIPLRSQSL